MSVISGGQKNKHKTHKHFPDGPCGAIVPGTTGTRAKDKRDQMAILPGLPQERARFVSQKGSFRCCFAPPSVRIFRASFNLRGPVRDTPPYRAILGRCPSTVLRVGLGCAPIYLVNPNLLK